MKSMTGFSTVNSENEKFTLNIVINSVNHKRLDINYNLPIFLRTYEYELNKLLLKYIKRGHVNIFIKIEYINNHKNSYEINEPFVKQIKSYLSKSTNTSSISKKELLGILALPEAIFVRKDDLLEEDLFFIYKNFEIAIESYIESTIIEGEKIKLNLIEHLESISSLVDKLLLCAPRSIEKTKNNLLNQLEELNDIQPINEKRFFEEIIYYTNKINIDEEIVRLSSHLDKIREFINNSSEPVGKLIDFYLQEMNREVNTCGSKMNDLIGTQIVIELKKLIEEMREQIQNIV